MRGDEPILLLHLPPAGDLPRPVCRYLETGAARQAKTAYKCRTRTPWYSVPNVNIPDFFLSYMSGSKPSLVENQTDCSCTNSVHAVRLKSHASPALLRRSWPGALTDLSCEIEGHPLGGGMLKLEPGEATKVLLSKRTLTPDEVQAMRDGVQALRVWRHCAV